MFSLKTAFSEMSNLILIIICTNSVCCNPINGYMLCLYSNAYIVILGVSKKTMSVCTSHERAYFCNVTLTIISGLYFILMENKL